MSTRERKRKRIDILVSGRGTNMGALVRAAMDPGYPVSVQRVISNVPDVPALELAERHDIPAVVIDHRDYKTREEHEAALGKVLSADEPDLICLAGYMRILTAGFVRKYRGRIINIHPSLLPAFRGIDTHERAIAAGVRIHGATVHFVTEGVDEGPIIAQVAVEVLPNENAEKLAGRVLAQENLLYPHALAMVASGSVRLSGGLAVYSASSDRNSDRPALFSPDLIAGE